jgi:N-acetylglucosamine-6-phosphate deacetylase
VVPVDLDWLAALPPVVRLVTLGAEQPLAAEATRLLVDRGVVVAIGHSGADAAQATRMKDAGARMATHLFNAMSPLGHRAPGVVGTVLTDPRVTPSLIADGVHVDPVALLLAFAAKRSVVLVTDSVAWRTGRFQGSGGQRLALGPDGAPRLADGTLAGSALTMDAAVRFVVERCGIPLARALQSASTVPASLLGLHDRGVLAAGRRADLVALGPDLRVEEVWAGGVPVRS